MNMMVRMMYIKHLPCFSVSSAILNIIRVLNLYIVADRRYLASSPPQIAPKHYSAPQLAHADPPSTASPHEVSENTRSNFE